MDAAVGAHGHGGAEHILCFGGTGAESDDFVDGGGFALAEADGFFDGELVEGVQGVLDPVCFDAGVGFVYAGFDLVCVNVGVSVGGLGGGWLGWKDGGVQEGTYSIVDYSFDGHEDLEAVGHCGLCTSREAFIKCMVMVKELLVSISAIVFKPRLLTRRLRDGDYMDNFQSHRVAAGIQEK